MVEKLKIGDRMSINGKPWVVIEVYKSGRDEWVKVTDQNQTQHLFIDITDKTHNDIQVLRDPFVE